MSSGTVEDSRSEQQKLATTCHASKQASRQLHWSLQSVTYMTPAVITTHFSGQATTPTQIAETLWMFANIAYGGCIAFHNVQRCECPLAHPAITARAPPLQTIRRLLVASNTSVEWISAARRSTASTAAAAAATPPAPGPPHACAHKSPQLMCLAHYLPSNSSLRGASAA